MMNMRKVMVYAGVGTAVLVAVVLLVVWLNRLRPKKSVTDEIVLDASNLSYAETDYDIMANQLYVAMKGAGTDTDSIWRVCGRLKTKDDWYALVKAFGVKSVSYWFYSFSGTLYDWLQDELSAREIRKLNEEVLAKIGVAL